MIDHNQDRSKDEGQQGIDRETEKRNRENETGQQGGGQQSGQQQTGGQSGSGFVGTKGDQSSDYLTKGEDSQDFASQGQGAQDTNAGTADVETGQRQQGSDDSELDDGSDSSR